ncbi:hypothetical protein C345_04050 [Cryptococcus neoformans A2-102-5]|nr:hypothetical protein C346_04175 [Cryptococcus neoformans var. grubii D17-1]OXG94926.1 hypothetical protein C345_04050 [Cryptococcus neoformans var. grubii A2-102-5]
MVPSSLLNPDTAAINSNKVTMVNNPCTPLSLCMSKTEEPVPGLVRPLVFVLVSVLVCSVSTFVFSAKRQRQRKSNHDIVLCAAKRQDIEKGSSKLWEKHACTAGQGFGRELVNTRAGFSLLYCIDAQG